MRTILLFLLLLTFTLNVAAEPPSISLREGRNEVSFRISNRSADYLNGLSVNVENEKLPGWLEIRTSRETVDLPGNELVTGKIVLQLNVSNAPDLSSAEIPVFFTDTEDNRWNYSFRVVVESETSSGVVYQDILHENYPNPFNPVTTIKYSISENRHVNLSIYNSIGQRIRMLVNEPQIAGFHSVQWDGNDESGRKVSSGLYIYRMVSGRFVQSKQMILVE